MFSERLSWTSHPNRIAQALEAARKSGAELLDLTITNPTEASLHYPHERIAEAFAAQQDLSYRPQAAGLRSAREAIAAYYAARGARVPTDSIFLTASTSESYSLLFKMFCNAGDEVMTPVPSYPLFEHLASLECVRINPYRLEFDGAWHLSRSALDAAYTPKTRILLLVSPNNPTGSVLSAKEIETVVTFARERNLPVVVDEVFTDYGVAKAQGYFGLADRTDALVFSLNGLSKLCGMPQVKLGWIAITGGGRAATAARHNLELLLDTYLSVSTPVQLALVNLLEAGCGVRSEIQTRIRANYQALPALLEGSAVHALQTDAGWSVILRIPAIKPEEDWVCELIEAGVVVHPGFFYDMKTEAYVIVSLLTPEPAFRLGIQCLRGVISACL